MSETPVRGTAPAAPRPGAAVPRRGRTGSWAADLAWFVVPLAVLVALWAAAVAATGVPPRVFPQVTDVARALWDMAVSGELARHLGASLYRVMVGSVIAVATALPFGIALGASRALSAFFSPLLRFSVALAGIAWIPIATLWLGYGDGAVIFIVWNAMFFALAYNTMLGVRRIPTSLLRSARSLGAGPWRLFWEVLLPGAMPSVISGLRIGLGYGWRGLVAAEIIATHAGLGYTLFLAQTSFSTDVIIAAMVIIGVLWLCTDRLLLAPLERRTVRRWGMTSGEG
ncbi:ABC transporter permease [Nocardiopsis changdeensis]|uniref:ABC transporter permease n=1 Tax=Nocardiopsis changdeensis TaxID=2831969 RepID=A0ABX8BMG8_9ACTN|nr:MULTISPECIES: ABC transporter permease [Nocardiopsis]QUX23430.1 ABC transporter permease [Nocardiopsis changdeensis]QYX39373.1 ABC transporter permease [Nocardiopsis sp. MT53]